MSLPTQRLFVSNKWYHQRVNHIKKLNLWHPIQNFGNFSFFQAFLGLWIYKVLLKLKKSYKSEFRHLFQWCILIPRKCQCKTPFQHTVPPPLILAYELTPFQPGEKLCSPLYFPNPLGIFRRSTGSVDDSDRGIISFSFFQNWQ